MICEAKHTKNQPSDKDWKCPKCGARPKDGGLVIGSGPGEEDCDLLHVDDDLECWVENCRYTTTGKAFAARLASSKQLVTCQHCKGKGVVASLVKEKP